MVAVAGIAVVLLALVALLLYYGAEALGKLVAQFMPDWHVPGLGSLRGTIQGLINGALAGARAIMLPLVKPAVDLLAGVGVWVYRLIYGAISGIEDAAAAVIRLATVILPGQLARLQAWALRKLASLDHALSARIHDLRDWARQRLDGLRAWAVRAVAAAVAHMATRLHQLRTDLFGALGDLRDWVRGLVATSVAVVAHEVDQLRGWTAQRLLGVEADIATAVAGVETDIAKSLATAERFATATAATAAGDVRELITDGVAAAGAGASILITDDLPELLDVIGDGFTDIKDLLGQIDLAKIGSLGGVLGLDMIMARVLTRYLRDCGVPNCRNLSGLGRALQDLLALVGGGAFLALLAEMVTDPQGMAREIDSVLGPVANSTADAARHLLGV